MQKRQRRSSAAGRQALTANWPAARSKSLCVRLRDLMPQLLQPGNASNKKQLNENTCCAGGGVKEKPVEEEEEQEEQKQGDTEPEPVWEKPPEEPKKEPTMRSGGAAAVTLLDDAQDEKMIFPIRRPAEPKYRYRKPPPQQKPRMYALKRGPVLKAEERHEMLEKHPNHLPFFSHKHYDKVSILKKVSRVKKMRGIIGCGRYYIEKDWKHSVSPWMDDEEYSRLVKEDEKRRAKFRNTGRVNRIVDLFLDKVLSWDYSREMYSPMRNSKSGCLTLLWLGRGLAKKVLNETCAVKEDTKIFEKVKDERDNKEFYIVNRVPLDIFFNDKEALFHMLQAYMLSPSLTCKERYSGYIRNDNPDHDCRELEKKGLVTRRVCVHQNLSLSLKPCLVPTCPNFERIICDHIYAFLPETISISSYSSMLHFSERFQRVEDLKGCIFITKPAYLCNARGIRFFVNKDEFEYFFHMTRKKPPARHGVLLQRYIEAPRLFDSQKFTVRFFVLIVVLPHRRVLGFIHYGIVFFANQPYEPVRRENFDADEELKEGKRPDFEHPVAKRSIGRVATTSFEKQVHITNYMSPKSRNRIRSEVMDGKAEMMAASDDCCYYICELLPHDCPNSTAIYIQMLFVSQCMLDYIQPIVQDYPGAFQTVSVDAIIDARNKLWVLGASTKVFSSMLTVAPRQRQIMSAVVQEVLGVTLECFYKARTGMPMYWDYTSDCEDFEGFFFTQDFNLFYETETTKQTNFIFQRRPPAHELLLEERYKQVDEQMDAAELRRRENAEKRKRLFQERQAYLAKIKAKDEEES